MKGRQFATKCVGFFLCAIVIAGSRNGAAQWIGDGDFGRSSHSVGDTFVVIAGTVSSGSEAENAHEVIAEPVALSPDLASSIRPALSATTVALDKESVISSNHRFLRATRHDAGSGWLRIKIADHEIEHYRNVTAVWRPGCTPSLGLNAASTLGDAIQQTGSPPENATAPVPSFRPWTGKPTSLVKANWLANNVTRGVQACDIDRQCSQAAKRRTGERMTIQTASLNSCAYAFDGECDEPELCYPGTDSEDCRGGRRGRQHPAVPLTYMCVTVYGACQMIQPIPIGAYCVCMTTYGAADGIAQ